MHGGDWAAYQRQTGSMPLDFSANISPLGMPESVKHAIRQAAEETGRYPDPLCRELREAIGKAEQQPPEYILCGNGAADLIWRLAAACRGGTAWLPVPAFAEYRAAWEANNGRVAAYPLREEDNFRLTEKFASFLKESLTPCQEKHAESGIMDFLRSDRAKKKERGKRGQPDKDEGRRVVLLCEPGNPSGVTTDPTLLRKILEICAAAGTLLAVDECFLDFLDDPGRHTMKPYLEEFPNLILFRAFTKSYAMAGIRLGYCLCSDPQLLDRIRQNGQPWSVSHLAQRAGIAALQDKEYLKKLRQQIPRERERLKHGLEQLGFRVIPGEANFLLFCVPGGTLADRLYKKGILIRDCADFEGLSAGWYRICVRTETENRLLLQTLNETGA